MTLLPRFQLRACLALALALSLAMPAMAAKGLDAQTLVRLERVSDPRLSGDGKHLLYALRETDMAQNKGINGLWIAGADGSNPKRLISKGQSASNARFSPDSQHVYFLSTRSGSSQIWRIALSGGEAEQISEFTLDVGSFVLSPDGANLVFSAEIFPECGADFSCTSKRLTATAESKQTGTLHDQLFIRHWDSWANGARSQLFLMSLDASAAPRLLTRNPAGAAFDGDVPSKPFGDDSEYTFSPDGKTLYFSARAAGKTEPWSTNFDLYQLPLTADAQAKNLTAANTAWDAGALVSPDGKKLYYRAMRRASFEADRFAIMERDLASGSTREVAPDWDHSADTLSISADGKTLYTATDQLGQRPLFAIDVRSGKAKTLSGPGSVGAFTVNKNALIFIRDDLASTGQLFKTAPLGGAITQISEFNRTLLSGVTMGESEQFTFKGWNDELVYAWLVKPVDFDPSKRYPIAFLIHGGPQGSFGNHFHYRWNPQTYAGQGFAAIMVDFHGSTGYGQKFTDSISGEWGGKPLVDLQKGLQHALDKYSFLDGSRACALGGSYGGYMTNWIAGAWPDGFKCLVTHAGIFDKRFMAYSTEELWFSEWENGGVAWDRVAEIEVDNPVNKVKSWSTPMLVIHGMRDFRVPFEQGIAAFTALQRKGIQSKFLWYPDENHWILKPENSILWHTTVNDWLHQHLDEKANK